MAKRRTHINFLGEMQFAYQGFLIKKQLRNLLKENKMSQAELGRLSGINKMDISRYFNGCSILAVNRCKIESVFGILFYDERVGDTNEDDI